MALERDVLKLALRLYQALDTPRSLTCALLARYGEWDQLVCLSVDPASFREDVFFSSLDQFRRDSMATAFLRKCRDLDTSVDLEKAAERTFFLCESKCLSQNLFLDDWFHLGGNGITAPSGAPASISLLGKTLNRARKWVRDTLGELPDFLNGKFGPGATFESVGYDRKIVGLGLTTYDKLHHQPTASSCLSFTLEDHLVWSTGMAGVWGAVLPNRVVPRVSGNRFASVPKDATKNRGICIEPGLNVFGQLAVGSAMRYRLKRRGLDLVRGQDLHRRMAREASRTGSHATLDLSNASDSVCYNLVRLLLPEDWFELLDELRSPVTEIRGRTVKLNKFSSMGNGYTFELETVVFAAVIHACGGRIGVDSFVYGDDMIVPTRLGQVVSQLLTLCGFSLNPKKSFLTGHFRESCGGDFWRGEDVRPFFLEESPTDAASWMVLHNRIVHMAHSFTMPELIPIARSCVDRIPVPWRVFGPPELGHCVLHGPSESWTVKIVDCIRKVRALVPVTRRKSLTRYGPRVALGAAVLGLPSVGLSPRDSVSGYAVRWLSFS